MSELAVPLRHTGVAGQPVLLLLHGLSSSGSSWGPFAATLPGDVSWLAPDLPGHGRSPSEPPYSFGQFAYACARAAAELPPGPLTVVGHSLGGAVALLLGTGLFGLDVSQVVTIGTKVTWTSDELDGARAVAAKPSKIFDNEQQALGFWRRVAGVGPAVEQDPDDVVVPSGAGWRLGYDQATAALGAAPVEALMAMVTDSVVVRGETDPLLSAADAARLDPNFITVEATGHSPHVEDPRQLATRLGLIPTPAVY